MELVFSFLEPESNARNAQVCKFWSEIVLDLLWHDVDQFGRLLNLLAPTQSVGRRLVSPPCLFAPIVFYATRTILDSPETHHPRRLATFLSLCLSSETTLFGR
jgi:hypothetical protein